MGVEVLLTAILGLHTYRVGGAAGVNLGAVAAVRFLAGGDTDASACSVKWLALSAEEEPECPSNLVLARVRAQGGEAKQAEQILLAYLERRESVLAWDLLATVWLSQGRQDQAIMAWERAGNWPKAIDVHWQRAVASWAIQPARARSDFRAVVWLAEKARSTYWMAEAYRMICATYRQEADWLAALEACERSLQLAPDLHTALAEKGLVLILGYGQREQGLHFLRQASELEPSNTNYTDLITHYSR